MEEELTDYKENAVTYAAIDIGSTSLQQSAAPESTSQARIRRLQQRQNLRKEGKEHAQTDESLQEPDENL